MRSVEVKTRNVSPNLIDRNWNPGSYEASRLYLLVDYLTYRLQFTVASMFTGEEASEVSIDQFNNGRRKRTAVAMNADLYNHVLEKVYLYLTDPAKNYRRLAALDRYMVPLVQETFQMETKNVFPEFEERSGGQNDMTGLIYGHADPNENTLKSVFKAFEYGAYAIRYARNEDQERLVNTGGEPLFAKGLITVDPKPRDRHLRFQLRYQPDDFPVDIEGRIYVLSNSLIFIGVEQSDTNAFFMVMGRDFKGQKHGGLIIRRHHATGKKSYFSSKAMIYRRKRDEPADDVSGKFSQAELPLLNKSDVEKLRNLANNEGHSIIFKESMSLSR